MSLDRAGALTHTTHEPIAELPRLARLREDLLEARELAQALVVAQGVLARSPHAALWLLTDGRTLEQPHPVSGVAQTVIVDFDDPKRPLGRCPAWAERWGAEYRLAPV